MSAKRKILLADDTGHRVGDGMADGVYVSLWALGTGWAALTVLIVLTITLPALL